MRKILRGLSAIVLTSALGACATVTRGANEQFTIETTPPDAHARTSSGFSCESTPCSIRMPRKDGFTVTVTKAGYKTVTTKVQPKLASNGAAGFVGNALIGGVIGAAVDVGSGATMDLTPNPLRITLDLVAVADAPPAPATPAAATPTAIAANTPPTPPTPPAPVTSPAPTAK